MMSQKIQQIHKLFLSGQLSPVELCEQCIAKFEQSQILNAYITHTKQVALQLANKSHARYAKGKPSSSLDGIPFAIKDNFSTTNIRTTCASNMLKDYVPNYNATVVDKLFDAGAVLMGKTNLDEFAMGVGSVDSVFGPVRNPWTNQSGAARSHDLHSESDWLVCGGSSGGSAVSVSSESCVFGISSDTGGSTRSPAAQCGLLGLKPTYGAASRHGLIPLVNSMDTPGVLSRHADDAMLILQALCGTPDAKDSTSVHFQGQLMDLDTEPDVSGLCVGIPAEYYSDSMHPDVTSLWHRVADRLESGGARLVTCSLPHTQYSIVCYSVLCACEVASNMARYDGVQYGYRDVDVTSSTEELYASSRHAGFNDVVRGRILAGNYFLLKQNRDKYYSKAREVRRCISDDFQRVFRDGIDVLLTPTSLSPAMTYREFMMADNRSRVEQEDIFTQPVNMAGLPAVSVPVGLGDTTGLPVGLQIIGRHFTDRLILNVAKYIENCTQEFPRHLNPFYTQH